jgi:ribosomal protein S18 acetylase RimI-like enzyme
MIKYSLEEKVDYECLLDLFKQVDWSDKTSDLERLKLMVENSQIVVTAWDDEKMVGFARCVTDYVFNGQINNVVVDQEYRGRGIGKELITCILSSSNKVTYILRGDPENIGFYKQIGFRDTDLSLVFNRYE